MQSYPSIGLITMIKDPSLYSCFQRKTWHSQFEDYSSIPLLAVFTVTLTILENQEICTFPPCSENVFTISPVTCTNHS